MLLTKTILKVVFISSLLFINIYYIVWPCTKRYLDYGVIIEVSYESLGSLTSPAISISRIGPDGL